MGEAIFLVPDWVRLVVQVTPRYSPKRLSDWEGPEVISTADGAMDQLFFRECSQPRL